MSHSPHYLTGSRRKRRLAETARRLQPVLERETRSVLLGQQTSRSGLLTSTLDQAHRDPRVIELRRARVGAAKLTNYVERLSNAADIDIGMVVGAKPFRSE